MKPSNIVILEPDRGRAAIVAELRRLLPRMEGAPARVLPFGVPTLDTYLPRGGLACGALHEIMPADADMPAAFGFVAACLSRLPPAGPVLFVSAPRGLADYGRPHGPGLNGLGLDPARMILVEAGSEGLALWAMEEALRSGAPAAVAGALGRGIDFKASQRLQLAARDSGLPLLLLRPTGTTGASAAATRWRIAAARAQRDRFDLMARWRWRVHLERCRNGRPGEWLVEWDHVTHRFSLAATLADTAIPRSAGAQSITGRATRS